MNYEQISALLDKYWDGETSLEEERTIKSYFATGAVDERLRNVAPLFKALKQEQAVEWQRPTAVKLTAGPSVSWRRLTAVAAAVLVLLFAGWWWLNRPAQTAEPLPIANQTTQEPPVTQPEPADTPAVVSDPAAPANEPRGVKRSAHPQRHSHVAVAAVDPDAEKAMEEIKAALALLSTKLNKGKREATKNLHEIETLDKVIKKPSES